MIGAALIVLVVVLAARQNFGDTLVNRVCKIIGACRPAASGQTADQTVIKELQDQISKLNLKVGFMKPQKPEEKA